MRDRVGYLRERRGRTREAERFACVGVKSGGSIFVGTGESSASTGQTPNEPRGSRKQHRSRDSWRKKLAKFPTLLSAARRYPENEMDHVWAP